jgi:acetyl-CoA carboxylase biotin carboxyl carrier protein
VTAEQERVTDEALAQVRENTRRLAEELAGTLRRVSVRSGEATVEVEWQPGPEYPAPAPISTPGTADVSNGDSGQSTADNEDITLITSPMVGTFYRASGPDEPPFVEPGDAVSEGQTVGMVEAMKLFNPIVADSAGVVTEIVVANAAAVEFGQPLIRMISSDTDEGVVQPADRNG